MSQQLLLGASMSCFQLKTIRGILYAIEGVSQISATGRILKKYHHHLSPYVHTRYTHAHSSGGIEVPFSPRRDLKRFGVAHEQLTKCRNTLRILGNHET
jgi:hypothetical protein